MKLRIVEDVRGTTLGGKFYRLEHWIRDVWVYELGGSDLSALEAAAARLLKNAKTGGLIVVKEYDSLD